MGYTKDQLLDRLKELEIDFDCYDHPVVLTVEAQAKYVGHLGGRLSKNLFLKDKKHRFYIVSALADTNVDLKVLSQRLGLGKGGVRMAPEEALHEILQVPLGCVTPFALINESARSVSLLLDQGFKAQECCFFHPLSNDTTLSLSASSLERFLTSTGRNPSYVDLEATPLVGKESPPDLAFLVPSEAPTLPDSEVKAVHTKPPSENNVTHKVASAVGETITHPSIPKLTKEKPIGTKEKKAISSTDPLAEATDVRNFVEGIIDKTARALFAEITKNSNDRQGEIGPSVLDAARKHITSDLENQTMSFKNAAYTQGFHAGFQSFLHSALQNMSLQK